ncbi:MAG: HAD-superfamily hydrolase [Promethearchaeota archaeon]|nr:MAG: HAD-superfamily hydrolase [Candidatus Lokiarchaeota archaeon]
MEKIALEKYKGIIWDLDGVIFDITEAIKKAVEDGVEKYNLDVHVDSVLQEVAHLIEEIQHYPVPKIILNSYNLLQVDFLEDMSYMKKLRIAVFLFNQFNEYREDCTIFKRIDQIIEKLHEKNVKLAILTNNKSQYAEEILAKFNLSVYFPTIIGFNDVSEVKPSPEGILKIIEKWNMKPEEVIFIGDMTTDVDAGKAAGVKMVCVASGLAEKNALLEHDPDFLVENTTELEEIFNF